MELFEDHLGQQIHNNCLCCSTILRAISLVWLEQGIFVDINQKAHSCSDCETNVSVCLTLCQLFWLMSIKMPVPRWDFLDLRTNLPAKMVLIAISHYDITIKTFIKILLFNTRDHGRLEGTKQCKFTENRSKNSINSRRQVE